MSLDVQLGHISLLSGIFTGNYTYLLAFCPCERLKRAARLLKVNALMRAATDDLTNLNRELSAPIREASVR